MSEQQQKLLEQLKVNDFNEVAICALDKPFNPKIDKNRWNVQIENIGYGYHAFQETLIVKHGHYYHYL